MYKNTLQQCATLTPEEQHQSFIADEALVVELNESGKDVA